MIWRRAFLAGLTAMASAVAAPGLAGDGSRVASPPADAAAGESQLAAPVSYYRAETVSASFAKGAVLFDQGQLTADGPLVVRPDMQDGKDREQGGQQDEEPFLAVHHSTPPAMRCRSTWPKA